MVATTDAQIAELSPVEVWAELESNTDSALVDVRTRPEWSFVGVPDLSEIDRPVVLAEWRLFPDLRINPGFADELKSAFGGDTPKNLFFICRSGTRSREAARWFSDMSKRAGAPVRCVNVAEGFEGDLNADRRRGLQNGWKARNLAWKQS